MNAKIQFTLLLAIILVSVGMSELVLLILLLGIGNDSLSVWAIILISSVISSTFSIIALLKEVNKIWGQ